MTGHHHHHHRRRSHHIDENTHDSVHTGRRDSHSRPHYIKQIRKWIKTCNNLHQDTCVPKPVSQWEPDDIPLWLIDTEQQCIVPGSYADRYLALSYVWPETRDSYSDTPKPRSLLLDNTTLTRFQIAGFLSDEESTLELPMVIRHAMTLVRLLKERYLWVDRLCIVQNDASEFGTLSQVAKMDKIYGGAYLTIIAAARDKTYENGMLHEWPASRHSRHEGGGVSAIKKHYSDLAHSKWASRGWTYQEQILCRRAIVLLERGMFWDCTCAVWDDASLVPGKEIALKSTDMGQRLTGARWADFGFYIDLICPYNGRSFSYPQDAAIGIMGVLNALGVSFLGGFIHGLPRLFLDQALLWQPFGVTSRRYDRTKYGFGAASLPSWSWLGWHGFVDPWSLRSGLSYCHNEAYRNRAGSWHTKSLVEWSYSSGEEEGEVVFEPGIFETYRGCLIDDIVIPQGWRGWKREDSSSSGSVYTHKTASGVEFKHPIPLTENSAIQVLVDTPAYLSCSTTTASFSPAAILSCQRHDQLVSRSAPKVSVFEDSTFECGPDSDRACSILVLQQPNGAFAGLLRLMDHELDDGMDNDEDEDEDEDEETNYCDLVAISTGSADLSDLCNSLEWRVFSSGYDSYPAIGGNVNSYRPTWLDEVGKFAMLTNVWMAFGNEAAMHEPLGPPLAPQLSTAFSEIEGRDQHVPIAEDQRGFFRLCQRAADELWPRPQDIHNAFQCEFYNVLWVEVKDGKVYRKACGWVPKYIWETHCTGPVNIKLG